MDEELSGVGRVTVRRSGEVLGSFTYIVSTYQPPGQHLEVTDAFIELGSTNCARFQRSREELLLQLDDGRRLPVFVVQSTGDPDWAIVAATQSILPAE